MAIYVQPDDELGIAPFDPATDTLPPSPNDVVEGYEQDEDAIGENRSVADDLDDEQDVTELHPNGMLDVQDQVPAVDDPWGPKGPDGNDLPAPVAPVEDDDDDEDMDGMVNI